MPPAAAVAAPIIMGVGGAAANQFLRGKGNTFQPTKFSESQEYNPDAFQYGGRPGGADSAVNRQEGFGDAARGRSTGYANTSMGLYGQGQAGLAQGQQARLGQQQAAQLMMARAQGLTPSIAQMQADRQMQQAAAAQASQAASARGPAGLALAQQGAANNLANAQSGISAQAQINAANERLAAEQAAMGAYTGLRSSDYAGAGTAFGAGAQAGQLGLGYGQLGLSHEQLADAIRRSQLEAGMRQQGMMSGDQGRREGMQADLRSQQVARDDAIFNRTLDSLGAGMQQGGAAFPRGGGGGGSSGGGGGGGSSGGGGLGGTGQLPNGGNF